MDTNILAHPPPKAETPTETIMNTFEDGFLFARAENKFCVSVLSSMKLKSVSGVTIHISNPITNKKS